MLILKSARSSTSSLLHAGYLEHRDSKRRWNTTYRIICIFEYLHLVQVQRCASSPFKDCRPMTNFHLLRAYMDTPVKQFMKLCYGVFCYCVNVYYRIRDDAVVERDCQDATPINISQPHQSWILSATERQSIFSIWHCSLCLPLYYARRVVCRDGSVKH